MRGTLALGGLVLCVGVAAISRSAAAEDAPTELVSLDYSAPDECPAREAFFEEIARRTSRAVLDNSGDGTRTLRVSIMQRTSRWVGSLTTVRAGSTSSVRRLEGDTCSEVVAALGLVAALSIDPRALTAKRIEPAPTEPTTTAIPEQPPPPPPPAPTSSTNAVPRPEAVAAPPPIQRPRPRWEAGAGAGLLAARLPSALLAASIFGGIALDRKSVFAPSIRLGIVRSESSVVDTRDGRAQFTFTYGRLEASPFRVAVVEERVSLRLAAVLGTGILDAEGSSIAIPQRRIRGWVQVGGSARVNAALSDAASVEAFGELASPANRESFFFQPNTPVYEIPPLVGFWGVGLAFRFL